MLHFILIPLFRIDFSQNFTPPKRLISLVFFFKWYHIYNTVHVVQKYKELNLDLSYARSSCYTVEWIKNMPSHLRSVHEPHEWYQKPCRMNGTIWKNCTWEMALSLAFLEIYILAGYAMHHWGSSELNSRTTVESSAFGTFDPGVIECHYY